MKKYLSKHPIIAGTLILSLTSITSRVIGFFYRIYLSRMFGAENLGILQLTGPICAMVFAMTGAGMQTAISKYVSSVTVKESKKQQAYLYYGLTFVLIIAGCCSYLVYTYADTLATHFLSETRTAPLLQVLAFSFSLSAAHACINGYFLGKGKTTITAASQLIEQCGLATILIAHQGKCQGLVLWGFALRVAPFGLLLLMMIMTAFTQAMMLRLGSF